VRLLLTLAAVCALFGCDPDEQLYGPLVDEVVVPIFTDYCSEQADPWPSEVRVGVEPAPTIRWEGLCYRDGVEPAYFNLLLSWAADRSDDFWDLRYIRPDVEEVELGRAAVPGAEVPDNGSFPEAEQALPIRELTEGTYALRIEGTSGTLLEFGPLGLPTGLGDLRITSGEVRMNVVGER
jgi:hypothetical protein